MQCALFPFWFPSHFVFDFQCLGVVRLGVLFVAALLYRVGVFKHLGSIIWWRPLILENLWPLFLKIFFALFFLIFLHWDSNWHKLDHLILFHSSWVFFFPPPCYSFILFYFTFCISVWAIYTELSSSSLILSLVLLSLQMCPSQTFFISVIELLITNISIWFSLTIPSLRWKCTSVLANNAKLIHWSI